MKKEQIDLCGFDDNWLRIIMIPIVGILMSVIHEGWFFNESWGSIFRHGFIGITFTIFYWEGSRFITLQMRKRIPEIDKTGKRLLIQGVLIIVYSVIASIFVTYVFSKLMPDQRIYPDNPILVIATTFLVIFLFISIYEGVYLFYQWKKTLLEKEIVKQEHIRSQLAGLRNQVNPHFLFNSLNTLMNIVADDQKLAIRYLQKLSKVFRYVLENREEQIISLESELEFIDNYIFMQKERFQENLIVKMDIPENIKIKKMPPLSLQILFENAIKHNIISSKKPLTIDVSLNEDSKLVVRNNLQLKSQIMDSTKIGLENIRKRYQYFTSEEVEVFENESYFTVILPLIDLQN